MAKHLSVREPKSSAAMAAENNGSLHPPPDVATVLKQASAALDEGDPDRALALLNRSRLKSPWISNAIGVCQIRRGHAEAAVQLYRGMVLSSGGLQLRDDVPVACKLNFAIALLANENFDGFERVLSELSHEPHPAVTELHAAYQHWRSSLTLWQRLRRAVTGSVDPPFRLGGTLGVLQ